MIDDYGHHPTEIRATLAAARQCGFSKVHVIFQPHRYTRTQLLLDEFATAFRDADSVLVLDIYAASEPPIPGITAELLANRITEAGGRKRCTSHLSRRPLSWRPQRAEPGDMILTLGAGSISQLGPQVLEAAGEPHGEERESSRDQSRCYLYQPVVDVIVLICRQFTLVVQVRHTNAACRRFSVSAALRKQL